MKKQGYLKVHFLPNAGSFKVEYELLDEPNLSAYTLYHSSDGTITSTNETRKDEETSILKGSQLHTPQNGSNAGGSNAEGGDAIGGSAKGDNNINLLSNTCNTYYNTPSICRNAERPPEPVLDDSFDGLSDKEILDVVKNELWEAGKLPYCYNNDYRHITEAIHVMTEWDTFHPNGYNDPYKQSVYELVNNALIEMCSSKLRMRLNNSEVTYSMVFDKINQIVNFDAGGEDCDGNTSLFDLVQASMFNYEKADKEKPVKS